MSAGTIRVASGPSAKGFGNWPLNSDGMNWSCQLSETQISRIRKTQWTHIAKCTWNKQAKKKKNSREKHFISLGEKKNISAKTSTREQRGRGHNYVQTCWEIFSWRPLNLFHQLSAMKFATKWSCHQTTRGASKFIANYHTVRGTYEN